MNADEIWIVDRVANGIAVCEGEGRVMREFPLSELPGGTGEGSVLQLTKDGFIAASDEEKIRRLRILKLEEKLFNE